MVRRSFLFAALLVVVFVSISFAAAANKVTGSSATKQLAEPGSLEFINSSKMEIKGVYISQTGKDKWSDNLLGKNPLKKDKSFYLDIDRGSFFGMCDMKIVYSDAKERLWKRLPIPEIFRIEHNGDGDARYERIKRSS